MKKKNISLCVPSTPGYSFFVPVKTCASVLPSRFAEEPIGDHCGFPVMRLVTITQSPAA